MHNHSDVVLYMQADPFSVLGGSTFFDALGHVDPATLFVGVADVTPTGPLQDVVQSPNSNAPTNSTQDVTGADATKSAERRMITVRPPPSPTSPLFPPPFIHAVIPVSSTIRVASRDERNMGHNTRN